MLLEDHPHGEDCEHYPHDDGDDNPGAHKGGQETFSVHLAAIGSPGTVLSRVGAPCELDPVGVMLRLLAAFLLLIGVRV